MKRAASDPDAITDAARLLEQGKLVAFPTETVYGLGADAENPAAVAAIFSAKGRPSDHPVIVHLAKGADLSHWAQSIPPAATQLIAAFWPGPLTLILKRAAAIPDAVSGGQDSIGLRCPSHPVALALLHAFKQGQGGRRSRRNDRLRNDGRRILFGDLRNHPLPEQVGANHRNDAEDENPEDADKSDTD